MEPLDAVTVSGAGFTVPEPFTYVKVYAGSEAFLQTLALATVPTGVVAVTVVVHVGGVGEMVTVGDVVYPGAAGAVP
jgi:hypothetical protein